MQGVISEFGTRSGLARCRELQYPHLFGWNFGEGHAVETKVRLDHLRRQTSQPLVKRNILECASGKHLQENDVRIAGVFDIVACVGRNEANIVRVEVNGAGVVDREKDGHASLARDPELPLRGVRMPVQLAHTAGLDRDQGGGEVGGDGEVAGINNAHLSSFRFVQRPGPRDALGRHSRRLLCERGSLDLLHHSLPPHLSRFRRRGTRSLA
jgi:hypothetical protein